MTQIAVIPVGEVMSRDVSTLSPQDTIEAALALFEEDRIGGAPVVDSAGKLVGVLTLSDLARTEHLSGDRLETRPGTYEMSEPVGEELTDELDPEEVFLKEDYSSETLGRELVGDWMTREPYSIAPETTLGKACKAMVRQHVHRVIVAEKGRLLGVLSSFDVVRCVAGMARR